MDFGRPVSRPRSESVVPMINVIFLLLVFFMLTATLAPPDPFDTVLPEAEAREAVETADALYVSAEGELAFGDLRGDSALSALAGRTGPLDLRADAGLPARDLARVLARLAALGVTDVRLRAVAR